MRLLEYQSKKLLSNFGLVFTESTPVDSMSEVRGTIERVGLPVVLKAQTSFGKRMKLSQLTVVVDDHPKIDHQLLYPTVSQMLVEVDKAVGYVGCFQRCTGLGLPLRTYASGLVKFTNISKIC